MKIVILIIAGILMTIVSFGQNTKSPSEPMEYIKKETIGGRLDFNSKLEKENKNLYLFDGIAYNKKDFAIFLWGQAVNRAGISSSKEAAKLWENIYTRELTEPEENALIRGFDAKLE
ncbi:hypothetical protein I5M27_09660 [Adhaeribacter sp. BT258]|uniref:Uncharacterized protein n=1 Tax=Adhaeribacter terrigena TaxID=2793070 RepID=A0ABS1C257_9BACT|nr:hypothetical protein [Adhaeribacter terrigena]MBK0403251.1 hypothetical protein [Adhaeribacter terrigena]